MESCVQFDPSPQNHYRMGLIYKRLGMNELSQREMDLRRQMLEKMSEETALGLTALKDAPIAPGSGCIRNRIVIKS